MRSATVSILAASIALAGCGTIGSAAISSEGPQFVGQPAANLLASKGAPLREMKSPSGATIYVYEAHNLMGATFCEASYFIRGEKVVGFAAHGGAPTCGGTVGDVQ